MVEHNVDLDRVFRALADPTRRSILARLKEGPRSISDLAEPFDMSFAATAKHVSVLEDADLVVREKRGRERICHMKAENLRAAEAWLSTYAAYWSDRLDALETVLKEGDDT